MTYLGPVERLKVLEAADPVGLRVAIMAGRVCVNESLAQPPEQQAPYVVGETEQ